MNLYTRKQKLPVLKVILLCLCASSFVQAGDSIYDTIRKAFPTVSSVLIIILGSAAILILGFIVAWEILKSDTHKSEKLELNWQNFGELVLKKGLTNQEIKILKNLIMAGKQVQADIIFNAPSIYENCLEAYLSSFQQNGNTEDIPYGLLASLRKKLNYSRLPVETQLSSTKQLNPGLFVSIQNNLESISKAVVQEVTEKVWSIKSEDAPFTSVNPGQNLSLWFIRSGDAEYRLKTQILESRNDLIVLEHTINLKRKQLRNWIRVDVNIPCKATIIKIAELKNETQKEGNHKKKSSIDGRIMDISGGGICLRLDTCLGNGSILSLNFDLPGSTIKNVQSEVLGYNTVKMNESEVFIHRLKFHEIETDVQEKIVRFVFEKNRLDSQFRQ
jgi:c-di-GMP-binding flagellar brake protein YcgR